MTTQTNEELRELVAAQVAHIDTLTLALSEARAMLNAAPAPATLAGSVDSEDRSKWTVKQWYKHVGAWENAQGEVCFGSVMALGAMLKLMAKARHASAAQFDLGSLKEQAEAWEAVARILDLEMPSWGSLSSRGIDSAVMAIGSLANKAAPQQHAQALPMIPTDDMCRAAREKIGIGSNVADHVWRVMAVAAGQSTQQHAQAALSDRIDRIDLLHGAYITRERKTTGENGWLLRNEHGLVRALDAFESEFVDCSLAASHQPAAAAAAAQSMVIGFPDPEAVFANFCDREGYPSDGDMDEALRKAFWEAVRMFSGDIPSPVQREVKS